MKKEMVLAYNKSSTSSSGYYSKTTASDTNTLHIVPIISTVPQNAEVNSDYQQGRYSVFMIADWFLLKEQMSHKKLQKLCYYAQAWSYAIKGYRLIDCDFQAWVHGPVSPALYERFKQFGFNPIIIKGNPNINIKSEDEELLESVWETYGDKTGNALEVLAHREAPWQEARKGYEPNERCTVVIDPNVMKDYYRSIYNQ